jgi:hypothetical protein
MITSSSPAPLRATDGTPERAEQPLSFVIDLHNLHVIAFAFAGEERTWSQFKRKLDPNDPLHLLHTASLLALSPRLSYAGNAWTGLGGSPRSDDARRIAEDMGIGSFVAVGEDSAVRREIALRAAESLADDLEGYGAPPFFDTISHRTPASMEGPKESELATQTRRLLTNLISEDERLELVDRYAADPNNTSLLMLGLSQRLYRAIHGSFWPSVSPSVDTDVALGRCETLLRMYTYLSLSANDSVRAWYSPQFDRLSHWENSARQWADMNRRANTSAASRPADDMPLLLWSIAYLLLRRSDGNPRKLLECACEFRSAHAQYIDQHFARRLSLYEDCAPIEVIVAADPELHELEIDFRGSDEFFLGTLEGFLASNGKSMMGHLSADAGQRRTIVKSDLHGKYVRERLTCMESFVRLGRAMKDGSRTILVGGAGMYANAKKRIAGDSSALSLVKALRKERVVICAGTGTTLASSSVARDLTWPGLVKDGLKRVVTRNADRHGLVPEIERLCESHPSALAFRMGGDLIRECLDDHAWAEWLNDLIGDLKPDDPRVLDAIGGLKNDCGTRVATTNYDLLIESALPRSWPCVVADGNEAKIESFLNDPASPYVFHIHGTYDQPESIILGNLSYGLLSGNGLFGYVRRLFEGCQLLFVGFSGFEDPTFGHLQEYHRAYRYKGAHFALMRERDLAVPDRVPAWITPVVYGADYSELPVFLNALREMALASP